MASHELECIKEPQPLGFRQYRGFQASWSLSGYFRGGRQGSPGWRGGGVNPDAVIRSARIARAFTAHGTRR